MRRRIGFVVFALVLAIGATGCTGLLFSNPNGTVQGIVTLNGAAPGDVAVEIVAVGTSFKTVADEDGKFEIKLPSPGQYTLQTRGVGLAATDLAVAVPKGKTVSGVAIDTVYLPPTPVTLNLDNPAHVSLIERPYPLLDISITEDPFGDTAVFFPKGSLSQQPPEGYKSMRFLLLKYPEVDTFEFAVQQIGVGSPSSTAGANGGNRSLSMVFGFEDLDNWWVAYFTYTSTTRVVQMKNGKQITPYTCSTGEELIWQANNDEYQEARISLRREGDEMVLSGWANGKAVGWTTLGDCRFPASDYTPGKVGLGGHSDSAAQSWYFRNIYLDIK